jgi:hypothetical protein
VKLTLSRRYRSTALDRKRMVIGLGDVFEIPLIDECWVEPTAPNGAGSFLQQPTG